MAANRKGHHHLRRHRRHPYAVDVAASADHAGGDRRGGDRRRRSRRRHRPSPRPQSRKTGKPDQTPEAFARFLPRIKQRTDAVINITTGGSPDDDDRGARAPGGDLQAGGRLAQHGLDEFRPLSDARALQGLQVRLGAAASRRHARPRLPEHLQGHRIHPADLRRQRHALRVRVLRHRPSLQARAFRRPRPGQAAVLRPVGVRHPRRHRHRIRRTSCT